MKKKLRAVVCGSTFGQFYLEALKNLSEEFEVVGLLAKGSERSKNCAEYYGVELYTEAAQLPDDIDLCCVVLRSGVMGGKGTELTLQLLERGFHVIQEQPVHHKDMAVCFKTARQKDVIFHTGNLYVHLPMVKRFIACAKAMLNRQEALYIDAAFASQVSYPMMHIFLEALPSIRPWKTGSVSREGGPFHVMTGTLGKIPAILRIHNEMDPGDPDNHLHLLHRLTIGSEGGSLTLTDTHGPVVWQPRLHIPENLNILSDLPDAHIEYMLENSTETLGPPSTANYRDILTKQWPRAIACDLSLMKEMIMGSGNTAVKAQQELLCSRQWQEITGALGYPVLRPGCTHQPLPVKVLQEAAGKIAGNGAGAGAVEFSSLAGAGIAACTEYADGELRGLTANDVNLFVERMNKAVFESMIYTLQIQGVLSVKEREYSIAEILSGSNTASQNEYLIRRWLEILSEHRYLERNGDYFYGAESIAKDRLDNRWKAVKEIWDGRLGSPLAIEYLIRNVEQLPQLMSGKQKAALLLFPEGKMHYADALYRETITARYLNKAVAEAVICAGAAKKFSPEAKTAEAALRVVEIGAGTGATTDVFVQRLQSFTGELKVEYLFTDVSNFFLLAARQRYKKYPWMQFQIVDIDKDFTRQGLEIAKTDIIIAAGVMNNAFDTDKVVEGLMQLLSPGGWLFITEPVREFPEILISQAFMMTRPKDDRKNTKTTFMSVSQWRKVFYKAGADEVLALPGDEHPLTPLGQKLFAVRKKKQANEDQDKRRPGDDAP